MKIVNALTIDVEDYFQVTNLESVVDRDSWKTYPLRVVQSTRKILSILEECKIKATFFVLGWVAEEAPELVKEIAQAGHELACHGYDHKLVYNLNQYSFREDIAKARRLIEDVGGMPVLGYRAPSFSITEDCRWAFDLLAEEGFRYDSSIVCTEGEDGNSTPYEMTTGGVRGIVEFPVSTVNLAGRSLIPIGGGYLRLFPLSLMQWAIARLNQRGCPAMVYLHPWELDPEQPRLPIRGLNRFRHYVNLSKTEGKLKGLLEGLEFSTASSVIEKTLGRPLLPLKREVG
jgi:polysaccharide deacetylase family protein (PEP-CTERM system associated)